MKRLMMLRVAFLMTIPLAVCAAQSAPASGAARAQVRQFDSGSDHGWTASFQVVSSPKGNLLIDPGKYDAEVASYVKSIGGVSAILITHGHWDKLRGLDAAMAANPKAPVYIHELDVPTLRDPVLNCSAEEGFSGTTDAAAVAFREGALHVGGYAIEAIHLPGHTRGASVFYFRDENLLFGGDTIMPNLVGSSKHPGGNEAERQASIKKFKRLAFPSDLTLYQGHGPSASYAELMKTNVDLK